MKAEFATDVIELEVTEGVPATVRHGIGRPVRGYFVIWSDPFITLSMTDPYADSAQELILVPSATGRVRLVLL